ncbi:MAG: hypothetical protein GY841_10250 [FCB group bacterium]|nr:hypothetical protein [FCB group bacterium]
MTTWIDEAFAEHHGADCENCDDGEYEAVVYWWGLHVECPNCGDGYLVEPPGPNPAKERY